MDFNLTEDQQMIKEQAADFAERFLAPTIEERDKNHVWDRKIINEMIENGFQGICFPEEYGGAGMDVLSYILAVEEMSKVDDGTGITLPLPFPCAQRRSTCSVRKNRNKNT